MCLFQPVLVDEGSQTLKRVKQVRSLQDRSVISEDGERKRFMLTVRGEEDERGEG